MGFKGAYTRSYLKPVPVLSYAGAYILVPYLLQAPAGSLAPAGHSSLLVHGHGDVRRVPVIKRGPRYRWGRS